MMGSIRDDLPFGSDRYDNELQVLMLDEFASVVDQRGGENLLRIARELAMDRLVIVTSHTSEILNIADQKVELTSSGPESRGPMPSFAEMADSR